MRRAGRRRRIWWLLRLLRCTASPQLLGVRRGAWISPQVERKEHNAHQACFACHRRTARVRFCNPKQLVNARWVNPKPGQEDAPVEDGSAESASESEDKPENENDDHNSDSAPPPQDDAPPPAHDSNPPPPSSSSSSASSSSSIVKQSVPKFTPKSSPSPSPAVPLPRVLQSRRRPKPSSRQCHQRNDEAWPTLPRCFPLNRRKYR